MYHIDKTLFFFFHQISIIKDEYIEYFLPHNDFPFH